MAKADYDSVVTDLRLADGTLWPIPITLDVTEELAETLTQGDRLALRDPKGVMLAVVHVEELFRPDRRAEAEGVYGTDQPGAPRRGPGAGRPPVVHRRAGRGRRSCRPTTTSGRSASHPASCGRSSPSRAGTGSSPSRPATRCTGPTRSSRCGPRREVDAKPAHPPGGRADQAGRHRPLHPGALLPGAARELSARHRHAVAAAPGHADGRAPRGGVARHHPQELRRHPLHRRPRPRRAGERLAAGRRSTAHTTPRICSGRTRRSWASPWCRSG